MFEVPSVPGKYKVVFRLNNPEAGKFGAPMKSFIIVEKSPEAVQEEEADEIPYVEETQPEASAQEEAIPEPFRFQEQLNTLLAMGFPEDDSKPVLVAVEGDLPR